MHYFTLALLAAISIGSKRGKVGQCLYRTSGYGSLYLAATWIQ